MSCVTAQGYGLKATTAQGFALKATTPQGYGLKATTPQGFALKPTKGQGPLETFGVFKGSGATGPVLGWAEPAAVKHKGGPLVWLHGKRLMHSRPNN